MELEYAIKTRRSIRKYKKTPIKVQKIIEALKFAIWAPSAHNSMPYYFMIIDSVDVKLELAKKMAEKYKKDLQKDDISENTRNKIIEESIRKFTTPPILIIPCISMERMHKYPDKGRQEAEYTMAIQSVSVAIQNLLLICHAHGFGSCWYCAPLFCQEVIREVLEIPDTCDPQTIISIGYPDECPSPPPRISIEKITFRNKWGRTI
ncbi:MAG: nitroreductase family protein [Candidatus Helarchaeota archaeon]